MCLGRIVQSRSGCGGHRLTDYQELTKQELVSRLERAHKAQREAERIAEQSTGELYTVVQELKGLNQTLRDFVAIASHDLRTPLTAVMGFAATLTRSWESLAETKKLEFAAAIERGARQLSSLVDDLLTISLIEAGSVQTQKEVIDLRSITESAMLSFSARASEITLRLDGRIQVLADPDHVERILVNYLTNALKYGAAPIEVAARNEGGWVEIRVFDHGKGIPEEFIPRLFEKFARADNKDTRMEKGTGLGLSIVRGLARANGGDAWYEPQNSRGACFVIRLPAAA